MNTMNTSWVSALMGFDGNQQGSAVGVPGATAAPAPAATSQTTGTTTSSPALPAQPSGGGGLGQLGVMLPVMVAMVVVVGFQMWRGSKQEKQRQELLRSVKKGDRVTTTSGMIGTIAEINDAEVVLFVEQGKIRLTRSAIAGVAAGKELADSKVEVKPSTVSV